MQQYTSRSLCSASIPIMRSLKAQWRSRRITPLILNLVHYKEASARFYSPVAWPHEKDLRYPLTTRLGGSRSRSERLGEELLPPAGNRTTIPPPTGRYLNHYTECTIRSAAVNWCYIIDIGARETVSAARRLTLTRQVLDWTPNATCWHSAAHWHSDGTRTVFRTHQRPSWRNS